MIETEKRVREAVRYLGFGRNEADERTLELIQQSFKDLEQEAGPKSICQIFDLNHTEDGRLVIGQMEIQSKSLSRNLKGCRQVVLFGATLGCRVGPADTQDFSDRYGKSSCFTILCSGNVRRILRRVSEEDCGRA